MSRAISEADIKEIEYFDTPVSFYLPDHKTDHIQKHIWNNCDFYEKRMLRDMLSRVSGGTFIDVGANIGNHTVFAATFMDVSVIAIEPEPYCFELLQSQIELNSLKHKVVLHNAAAGGSAGFCETVTLDSSNIGMTIIKESADGIPMITLDSLGEEGVSVIKIDVEGYEEQVLKGSRKLLETNHPLLYIECADEQKYANISKLLASYSYSAVAQYNATPTFLFMHLEEPILFDAIRTQGTNIQEFTHQHINRTVKTLMDKLDGSQEDVLNSYEKLAGSVEKIGTDIETTQRVLLADRQEFRRLQERIEREKADLEAACISSQAETKRAHEELQIVLTELNECKSKLADQESRSLLLEKSNQQLSDQLKDTENSAAFRVGVRTLSVLRNPLKIVLVPYWIVLYMTDRSKRY